MEEKKEEEEVVVDADENVRRRIERVKEWTQLVWSTLGSTCA